MREKSSLRLSHWLSSNVIYLSDTLARVNSSGRSHFRITALSLDWSELWSRFWLVVKDVIHLGYWVVIMPTRLSNTILWWSKYLFSGRSFGSLWSDRFLLDILFRFIWIEVDWFGCGQYFLPLSPWIWYPTFAEYLLNKFWLIDGIRLSSLGFSLIHDLSHDIFVYLWHTAVWIVRLLVKLLNQYLDNIFHLIIFGHQIFVNGCKFEELAFFFILSNSRHYFGWFRLGIGEISTTFALSFLRSCSNFFISTPWWESWLWENIDLVSLIRLLEWFSYLLLSWNRLFFRLPPFLFSHWGYAHFIIDFLKYICFVVNNHWCS